MATDTKAILCAVFITLVSGISLAQTTSFDIKGVRLGASEADVKEKLLGVYCKDARSTELANRVCRVDDLYGGAAASFLYFLRDGKVNYILVSFASKEFDAITDAMKERFGNQARMKRPSFKSYGRGV